MCVCPTRLLNDTTGSLLDDVQLVDTLQTSKVTATEVSEQLKSSEQTKIKLDSAIEVRCIDKVILKGFFDELNTFWTLCETTYKLSLGFSGKSLSVCLIHLNRPTAHVPNGPLFCSSS